MPDWRASRDARARWRLLVAVFGLVLLCSEGARAQHVFTAPHGGTLLAIGTEFAHVELVHDPATGDLVAYVLDGEAKLGVRLAQETIDVDLLGDSGPGSVVLRAVANPLTGEQVGDSSEFRGRSERLRGRTSFDGVIRRLGLKGKTVEGLAFNVPLGANHHRDLLVAASGGEKPTLALLQGVELVADASLASSFGGVDLFVATQPGFGTLVRAEPSSDLRPLEPGTEVALEIVDADSGASAMVVGKRLVAVGDRAPLGVAPSLHVHPSWQLAVPSGETLDASITFRLVSTTGQYHASEPLRLRIIARR